MPARRNGIVCASPSRYTSDERATILSLIRLGGEVAAAPERIGRAKLIATAWVGGRIVGVAALKRPLDSYRSKVAGRAGVKLKPSEWPFELGYVFVLDDQRGCGLARSLTDALIREAGRASIFATVRTANQGMQAVLRRFEFAVAGRDYLSDDGERLLSLWIRRRPA